MLLVGTDQLWMAPGFKTYQNARKNVRMAIQEFISWENFFLIIYFKFSEISYSE